MGKFVRSTRPAVFSPVTATGDAPTHEGGDGFARDAKSELYLLAVANMVSESSFYEGASQRDERFRSLVRAVAAADFDWVARFVPYLRREMFMRSASIVMAAEAVHARLEIEKRTGARFVADATCRRVVDSAIVRADEPGEMLAYWASRYGSNYPKPVKRGVADAVTRILNEYAAMKYDGTASAWRLGDVINLTHPIAKAPWQGDLFQYLLDRRHHAGEIRVGLDRLPMIRNRRALEVMPVEKRRAWLRPIGPSVDQDDLRIAGATWEWLSGWLPGGMDAAAWEAVIPSMGHMALLRNLRNFDQAKISVAATDAVIARITDPAEVAKGMQFPFRYWAAHNASRQSLNWGRALSRAMDLSCSNVPELPGGTLIGIDTSASMTQRSISAKSSILPVEAAAVFASALARRQPGRVDVVSWASQSEVLRMIGAPGTSVLSDVGSVVGAVGRVGHGTLVDSLMQHYVPGRHKRVVVFSDLQIADRFRFPVDASVFAWNLVGYGVGAVDTRRPNVHEVGGMSDKAFSMIAMLDRGKSQDWPF